MMGSSAGAVEFEARVESPLILGDAKVSVGCDELVLTTAFDRLALPYAQVDFMAFEDYRVSVRVPAGMVYLTRMGRNAEWLYDKMWAAYNDAVLGALMVSGECLLDARGHFEAYERGREFGGPCVVRLYGDCVCLLPPNVNARRIPLCFLAEMGGDEYTLELALVTGERYAVRRLGSNLDNLRRKLMERVRILREDTAKWHAELAEGLSAEQAAYATRLAPLGAAFMASDLATAAPPLLGALEEKARRGRMADTFDWLAGLSGTASLCIGAKPAPATEGLDGDMLSGLAENPLLGGLLDGASGALASSPLSSVISGAALGSGDGQDGLSGLGPQPILWVMAPDAKGRLAAVELALPAGEAAATYLYRIPGDWPAFARQIDRALEASAFQRGPVLLSEEELALPEHASEAMLVRRTPAIGLLRSCFAGRAIHSSRQRWLGDIERAIGAL